MHSHGPTLVRLTEVLVALALFCAAAKATDHPVGHDLSLAKYGSVPAVGKLYKILIKAGKNGNPATFPLPADHAGGWVVVQRDGGVLGDPLTAGTWFGLGKPAGIKGWKYRNRFAPQGGAVSSLIIRANMIKLVAKGTGSMPTPAAPDGVITTVIAAGAERYCAEAAAPFFREVDGALIEAKNQLPPAACSPCIPGVDSDGDRLDNCYESNTGVYFSPLDTGTDPLNPDTDGDGIQDGDEVLGSVAGLDLPGMGVSPLHKDILVEYDWFDDSNECGPHSHRPTDAALATVTATFAAAPVTNPDGTTGIHFIHDRGQGGLFAGGNLIADADGVLSSGVNSGEFNAYKAANFAANRNGYFHYTILPHRYNTNSDSSGQAELSGDDLIVSLYCAYSSSNVARTIVHELGHNLGLRHGGFENCNYKPNYNSVMNYLYQFPGIDSDCDPYGNGVVDYSIGSRIDLDETSLDENLGTCGTSPVDWNGNSSIESGVALDLNAADDLESLNCGGTLTTLKDYDDWAHIRFSGLSDFDGMAAIPAEVIDCTNPAPH